jgi:hypothetical protein
VTEKYHLVFDNVYKREFKKFHDRFVCPCCYYPTLSGRNSYEVCGLCDWEDDGQDDDDADNIAGGPNKDYSLTEARNNFKEYLTMYRPEDVGFQKINKERIKEIKRIYDKLLSLTDRSEIEKCLRHANRLANDMRKL